VSLLGIFGQFVSCRGPTSVLFVVLFLRVSITDLVEVEFVVIFLFVPNGLFHDGVHVVFLNAAFLLFKELRDLFLH
jgi:hypothetical protein